MRLRIIEPNGAKNTYVEIDDNKPFEEAFHLIENAFQDTDLLQNYDLHRSVFVGNKKVRPTGDRIEPAALPKNLDLSTCILVLRAKHKFISEDAEALSYSSVGASPVAQSETSNDQLAYKERIRSMYATYDPAKLRLVEGTLQKYKGREEAVLRQLVLKYGPEPDPFISKTIVAADSIFSPKGMGDDISLPQTITPVSLLDGLTSTVDEAQSLPYFASPKSRICNEAEVKMARYRKALSNCIKLNAQKHEHIVASRYFQQWIKFCDRRKSEEALRSHVWKRGVTGFQLADKVVPVFEVSDLDEYVGRQRGSVDIMFSDNLQKALRQLLSILLHLNEPLECQKFHGVRREEYTLRDQFSPKDLSPVKDTALTASVVQHAARLLQFFYDTYLLSKEQQKQFVELQKSYEALKSQQRTISPRQKVFSDLFLSQKVKKLELEVQQLQQRLKDAQEECSNCDTHEMKKVVTKLQNELAKARATATKFRQDEGALRSQLEEARMEAAKLRERLTKSEIGSKAVRNRTSSTPVTRGRSTGIRHGMFSEPIVWGSNSKEPSEIQPRTSETIRQDYASNSFDSSSNGSARSVACPLCHTALVHYGSLSSEENSLKRVAFCFSCRRSFTFADLRIAVS